MSTEIGAERESGVKCGHAATMRRVAGWVLSPHSLHWTVSSVMLGDRVLSANQSWGWEIWVEAGRGLQCPAVHH